MQDGSTFLSTPLFWKLMEPRRLFRIFFLTVLYTVCSPLPPDTTCPAGTSKETEFESRLVSKSRIRLMAKLKNRAWFGKQRIRARVSCLVVHFCIRVKWNYVKRDFSGESLVFPKPETQKLDLGQNSLLSLPGTETPALASCWNQNILLILLTWSSAVNLSPLLKQRLGRIQFCALCLILYTFLNKEAIYNFDKFPACKYIQKGASEKNHNPSS